jgi:NADH dehydrogenase
MSQRSPVVVIVGGGFGGFAAARALKKAPVKVILIDRSNHHLFQPLLYQVATSVLAPGQIASPIRSILRSSENTTVIRCLLDGVGYRLRKIVGLKATPHLYCRHRYPQIGLRFSDPSCQVRYSI